VSHKHNPEFTMLEWYEAYADYEDGARLLEELVRAAATAVGYDGPLKLGEPWRRLRLTDAIRDETGIDVLAHHDRDSLVEAARAKGVELPGDEPWPKLVDSLLSKHVEPKLDQPTFLVDYPVELSPFAKRHRSEPGLVERWECFVSGIEIANAFSELNDPDEQRARFEEQRRDSAAGDDETQPYDEDFIRALEHGMPPTSGVGLGIDRLVMVLSGRPSIREVVLFPAMRT
jgi:lysyl-tRNA synthetase class 2